MLFNKIPLDTGNLTIHIPLIRFFRDPTLFMGDPIYTKLKFYMSYFFRFVSFLNIPDNMIYPFIIIGFLIFETSIIYSLMLIWQRLGFSQKIVIWSAVILASGYLPSLGASKWWGTFTHQMPAMFFILLSFYFAFRDKFVLSAIFIGLSFNIHMILAFPAAIIWGLITLYKNSWRSLFIGAILIFVISLPSLLWFSKLNLPTNQAIAVKILYIRSMLEMFPSKLGFIWIPFLVFSIIVVYELRKSWDYMKLYAMPFILTTIFCITIAFVGELLSNITLIRLQSLRGTVFFVVVFLPFLIRYIYENIKANINSLMCFFPVVGQQPQLLHISMLFPLIFKKRGVVSVLGALWVVIAFLGPILVWSGKVLPNALKYVVFVDYKIYLRFQLLAVLLALGIIYKNKIKFKLYPVYALLFVAIARSLFGGPFSVQDKYWKDVQMWARENTPKEAIFLTPPEVDGFRVYSQRAIVFDWKAGPGVDTVWWHRLKDFNPESYTCDAVAESYRKMSWEQKTALAKKYGATYIVVPCVEKVAQKPVYKNKKWAVYQLR